MWKQCFIDISGWMKEVVIDDHEKDARKEGKVMANDTRIKVPRIFS